MHAQYDTRVTSAPGRAAFLARFEAEVDPDSQLDPEERRRRAEHARSAYFTRLALASAAARRTKRASRASLRGLEGAPPLQSPKRRTCRRRRGSSRRRPVCSPHRPGGDHKVPFSQG